MCPRALKNTGERSEQEKYFSTRREISGLQAALQCRLFLSVISTQMKYNKPLTFAAKAVIYYYLTCEDNILFQRVKISCYQERALIPGISLLFI